MAQVTALFGIQPQAHYQARRRNQAREVQETYILDLVHMLRQKHPRMGGRKLLDLLRPMLAQEGIAIGRDRFFALLRAHDLLVPRQKKPTRTTWPGHLRVPNRLPGLTVNAVHQVWVVDISYIRLRNGRFVYVFLVMDLYSRYVLAAYVAPSLAAEEAVVALHRAITLAACGLEGLIHHSDHGSQYTSHHYRNLLRSHGITASMGAVGNAYDNAFAERVIGTLKNEYALEGPFDSLEQAQQAWNEGVYLYNACRPHLSLNYARPEDVYLGRVTAPALVFPPETEATC